MTSGAANVHRPRREEIPAVAAPVEGARSHGTPVVTPELLLFLILVACILMALLLEVQGQSTFITGWSDLLREVRGGLS